MSERIGHFRFQLRAESVSVNEEWNDNDDYEQDSNNDSDDFQGAVHGLVLLCRDFELLRAAGTR